MPCFRKTILALSMACLAGPALAETDLQAEIDALKDRLSKLEQHNADLEQALDSDRISDREPELATRIKAVENDVNQLKPAGKLSEALNGVSVGASITTVAQQASHTVAGEAQSQLNWRGDVEVNAPAGELGNATGKVYMHLRMGQGEGLKINGGTPVNATVFKLHGNGDDSNASVILAQAWYQMDIPLPLGGVKDDSRQHLEVTVGKIDPYGFFDQNNGSDDESAKNLNLLFVHNPLLDAGGGAVFDQYGFTPGARVGYFSEQDSPERWGVSLGVFATGGGAQFDDSFSHPFSILQFETTRRLFDGQEGNYRLYAWNTDRGTMFDDTEEKQSGWGFSADQRLGDGMTLWGRYGQGIKGHPQYDQALTVGMNFSGNYWGRGKDMAGLSLGYLRASDDYRASSSTSVAAEQVAEAYYNWALVPKVVLTPDVQYIRHPGADSRNDDVVVLGLRATLSM
jgi:hypothetical protein